jgi:hypothetical protein
VVNGRARENPRASGPRLRQTFDICSREGGAMKIRSLTFLMAAAIAAATAPTAIAHPGHDENSLGIQQQTGLRRGLHGAGDGMADDSLQADPPTTGRGLGSGGSIRNGPGGVGGLRGSGLGNYGAGSVGEPGPGGLGAMKNGGLGASPPRPR